jgi:hypothetical protein
MTGDIALKGRKLEDTHPDELDLTREQVTALNPASSNAGLLVRNADL